MQITPISNFYYNNRNVVNNSNNRTITSFGAHYDYLSTKENIGDGVRYKLGHIHNYSAIFRGLEFFLEFPKLLRDKFPDGVTIYDYACSAGYEPVSILLGFHNYLPQKDIDKYVPIMARDYNSEILKIAKQGRLRLDDDEQFRLSFFNNIDRNDFFNIHRKNRYGQLVCDCKDKLKKDIVFEEADLFEDLDKGKLSQIPCVVLIRNAWQYMTKNGQNELASKLYNNLKPGSIVIIGGYDEDADKVLLKNGFSPIKGNYHLETYDYRQCRRKYGVKNDPNISDITNYCFERK